MDLILLMCIIGAGVFIAAHIMLYLTTLDSDYEFIEFEKLKTLYEANPDSWDLYWGIAAYETPHYYHRFKFKPIGYLKYNKWKNDLDKKYEKEREDRRHKEFLEYTEMDLKKIKE